MEQNTYKVYARLDSTGKITAVHSSAFLQDTTDWTLIDEGTGDRYHHAQGHYLPDGLHTSDGIPRYHWDGTQVIQRTEEEIEEDRTAIPPAPMTTEEALVDTVADLMYQMYLIKLGLTEV